MRVATLGPSVPGTVANSLSVKPSWSGTSNIAASDNTYMTVALDGSDPLLDDSRQVRATNFSPSLVVPAGAVVDGVEVEIERKASNASEVKDVLVQLVSAGNLIGNNLADTGITWPNTDTVKTYGGSSNLWGATFTDTTINSTFGVAVSVITVGAGAVTASIDRIRMTVTYHEAAAPSSDPFVSGGESGRNPMAVTESPTKYIVGQTVRLWANIQTDDADTDPTALTLTVKPPGSAAVSYTYAAAQLTKDSTGDYYRDVTFNQVGWWAWGYTGTGTAPGLGQRRAEVVAGII
jgi:hypothetical protein